MREFFVVFIQPFLLLHVGPWITESKVSNGSFHIQEAIGKGQNELTICILGKMSSDYKIIFIAEYYTVHVYPSDIFLFILLPVSYFFPKISLNFHMNMSICQDL